MLLRGIFILMSIFHIQGAIFGENDSPKIVVVGGGLAGLTAGYRLHQKGMDVEVYEARNRVGGRIFSVNISGNTAELGDIYEAIQGC